MATFYSIQSAKVNDVEAGTYTPNPNHEEDGNVRLSLFSYNTVGTEATSDTIELCEVPAGARIVGVFIANEDLGTTCTFDIGDSGDTDRLVTGFVGGTASSAFATMRRDDTETDESTTLGFGYRYTAKTTILATLTNVASPATDATIRGYLLYSI